MTVRSRMSSIMGLIGPERLELFALEFKNLVKIYMTVRSGMSLIMGVIRPEQLELFAVELESSLE